MLTTDGNQDGPVDYDRVNLKTRPALARRHAELVIDAGAGAGHLIHAPAADHRALLSRHTPPLDGDTSRWPPPHWPAGRRADDTLLIVGGEHDRPEGGLIAEAVLGGGRDQLGRRVGRLGDSVDAGEGARGGGHRMGVAARC
jgi:hypothetical protein